MKVIYVNDLPLTLASRAPTAEEALGQGRIVESPDEKALEAAVAALEHGVLTGVWLYEADSSVLMARFQSHLRTIEAAGGVVISPQGRLLMIKRFGRWEFPKGKVEPGEAIEATALREIEEECGVSGMEITRFLTHTMHTYRAPGGKRMLKITHWYAMRIDSEPKGKPQREEGIAAVAWATPKDARLRLEQSYRSVRRLIDMVAPELGG
jgi:ADP-ribose pyrophosphatase YjhB (NUDIX family)